MIFINLAAARAAPFPSSSPEEEPDPNVHLPIRPSPPQTLCTPFQTLDNASQPPRSQNSAAALSSAEEHRLREITTDPSYVKTIPGASVSSLDIERLVKDNWLNDKVIDFYNVLLNNRLRERLDGADSLLAVHCFNTNFYRMLTEEGFAKVASWTKKFALDVIIIPINLANTHWCCAAINIARHQFEVYNSLGKPVKKIFKECHDLFV